ncbi:MAG: MerR family transcriptional regulator [Candidatus Schekmanbacteria bacterium]|nr:MAG: MerR family transcriptional regulator [Candidatus Schekmanbacteria bacterium]
MKIGEIARKANTTIRTLRYYEEEGILTPSGRTAGGVRCYNDDDLKKLMAIQMLKKLNMSLAEIKNLINARKENKIGGKAAKKIFKKLQDKIVEVDNEIKRFRMIKQELERTKKLVEECINCENEIDPEQCGDCNYKEERRKKSNLYASFYN